MIRPCPDIVTCESGSLVDLPYLNLSSEQPDTLTYLGRGYSYDQGETPPLQEEWTLWACGVALFTTTAPYDAELVAMANAIDCAQQNRDPGPPNNPTPRVCNNVTFCRITFSSQTNEFSVPAGTICTPTQSQSDQQAVAMCGDFARRFPLKLTLPAFGCFNQPYSDAIKASGGVPPYHFSVIDGALPPGLTLNDDGTITGTPTTSGQYTFTARVSDSLSTAAEKEFHLNILGIAAMPPSGQVYVPYTFQLEGTGGTAPYLFSKVGGRLPAGINLSSSGLLSGTPTEIGTFTSLVLLEDIDGNFCEFEVPLTISDNGPDLGFGWEITVQSPPGRGGMSSSPLCGAALAASLNVRSDSNQVGIRGTMKYTGGNFTLHAVPILLPGVTVPGAVGRIQYAIRRNFVHVGGMVVQFDTVPLPPPLNIFITGGVEVVLQIEVTSEADSSPNVIGPWGPKTCNFEVCVSKL